jgi:hypothetical protein
MPLQYYAPVAAPCRLCGDGFEHRQASGAQDLRTCPRCGQAVQRRPVASVNSLKLSVSNTVSRARQAGFTVLKRTSGNEFEKQ